MWKDRANELLDSAERSLRVQAEEWWQVALVKGKAPFEEVNVSGSTSAHDTVKGLADDKKVIEGLAPILEQSRGHCQLALSTASVPANILASTLGQLAATSRTVEQQYGRLIEGRVAPLEAMPGLPWPYVLPVAWWIWSQKCRTGRYQVDAVRKCKWKKRWTPYALPVNLVSFSEVRDS